jgi:hypothetical protein
MKNNNFIILGLAIISATILFGCKSIEMKMPSEVNKKDFSQYKVEGRQGFLVDPKLKIGKYKADVDRGWTSSGSSSFLGSKKKKSSQKYSYKMKGPNGFSFKGSFKSSAKAEKDSVKILGTRVESDVEFKSTLKGTIKSSDKKETYKLFVGEDIKLQKNGSITFKKLKLEIKGTKKVKGSSYRLEEPSGYIIYENGVVVGVVEMIGDGKVHIKKGIDSRTFNMIMTSAAALLLYQDVGKEMKK